MHDANCFITLTYDDNHLPWDGSLNKKHLQDFMKRLRWHHRDKTIRFFACGEYGEKLSRPHYHALLFNHDFQDKTLFSSRDGINTYTSEVLEQLWPWGFSTVGQCTWAAAAYCARYVTKKRTGKDAQDHYWRQTTTDLEVELEPEYATMSTKPGIGKTWFDSYRDDCFPTDYITHQGKKLSIPKYYDKLLAEHSQLDLEHVKQNRKRAARKWDHETTPTRLAAREKCAEARLNQLNRPMEK